MAARNSEGSARNQSVNPVIKASSASESELIVNSFSTPVITRNMKGSTGWVHSPAMFRPLLLTQRDLVEVAKARGMRVSRFRDIEYVRAGRRKATGEIYIWPTTADDPDRIEVQHGKSTVWINLITLLSKEKMMLEPGYRERYVVRVVGANSPAGHAIMFDMTQHQARRGKGSSTKTTTAANQTQSKAQPQTQTQPPMQPQTQPQPQPQAPAQPKAPAQAQTQTSGQSESA
ncbi:MAG: hypothetical protein ACOY94_24680 [Bacillota bacterium]